MPLPGGRHRRRRGIRGGAGQAEQPAQGQVEVSACPHRLRFLADNDGRPPLERAAVWLVYRSIAKGAYPAMHPATRYTPAGK